MFKCCNCDSQKPDEAEVFGEGGPGATRTGDDTADLLYQPGGVVLEDPEGAVEKTEVEVTEDKPPVEAEAESPPAVEETAPADPPASKAGKSEHEERQALVKSFLKKASSEKGVSCVHFLAEKGELVAAKIKVVADYKEFSLLVNGEEKHRFPLSDIASCLTFEAAEKAKRITPEITAALEKVSGYQEKYVSLIYGSNGEGEVPLLFKSAQEREGFTKVINVLKNLK